MLSVQSTRKKAIRFHQLWCFMNWKISLTLIFLLSYESKWMHWTVLRKWNEKKLMNKKYVFFIPILIDPELEYLVYIEVFLPYSNVLLYLVHHWNTNHYNHHAYILSTCTRRWYSLSCRNHKHQFINVKCVLWTN